MEGQRHPGQKLLEGVRILDAGIPAVVLGDLVFLVTPFEIQGQLLGEIERERTEYALGLASLARGAPRKVSVSSPWM